MTSDNRPLTIELTESLGGALVLTFGGDGPIAGEIGAGRVSQHLTSPFVVNLGSYSPELVAMIRDVADQELAVADRQSWREAFEDIMRTSTDDTAKTIAARALGSQPEGEPYEDERSQLDRVAMTPAGDACERYRAALEQITAIPFDGALERALTIAETALEASK